MGVDLAAIKMADTGGSIEDALSALKLISEQRGKKYRATTGDLMADLGPAEAHGILSALEAAAANDALLARVVKVLDPPFAGIELSRDSSQEIINQLESAGVWTADQAALLRSLTIETYYPFANVTAAEIVKSRAM